MPVSTYSRSFYDDAEFLPGATAFAEDPALQDPVSVVRLLKAFPDIVAILRKGSKSRIADADREPGRPREAGDWELLFLAFLLTDCTDMRRFHSKWQGNRPLWKACGFTAVPSYQTLYLRFVELEQRREAFDTAAKHLINKARASESRIGRHVFMDGAGMSTHATLEHHCVDPEACRELTEKASVARLSDDLIPEVRKQDSETSEDKLTPAPSGALKALDDAEVERLGLDKLGWGPNNDRPFRWYRQRGHLFRCRDTTAAPRMYSGSGTRTRFWIGWNGITATDGFTGGPLVIDVESANVQEFDRYPSVLDQVKTVTGNNPQCVSLDRGFATKANYELNTRQGIGTAMPWREPTSGKKRRHLECDEFDRHGKPRCRHCGGPSEDRGDGLGFLLVKGEPYIRYRCALQLTPACARVQRLACKTDWRFLQPLSLTDRLYHQLRQAHQNYERVHLHMRVRYRATGKDTVTRVKRLGVECARLRAAAIRLIEWFFICLRHGYIGSHPTRNTKAPAPRDGNRRFLAVIKARRSHALDLPYGTAARATGWALHGPPGPVSS